MINIEKSITIHRPIEEVFTYVSDLTHSGQWQTGLVEIRKTTGGPVGVGTQYVFVRVFIGRKMEASNEITEFVPTTKVAFKTISGPIPLEASYLFETSGKDTKLTSKIAMQAKGFISMAEPLISGSLQKDVETSLGVLKNMLEGQAVTV
jgi:hypothetical protein